MGKNDYLEALKRAMTGLPPEAQAKTLAFYEQRFVDGVAAGRSEADIAAEQDDPKKIAMTLRANAHLKAFEEKKNATNLGRMLVAFIGLAIFNLFMLVPALVYASLLATLYACGLAFYLGGSVITGSGLSGANEIKLDGPFRNIFIHSDEFGHDTDLQTKMSITAGGIRIYSENADPAAPPKPDPADDKDAGSTTVDVTVGDDDITVSGDKRSVRVIKRAESVASDGILISTDLDEGSRAMQTLLGFGMVLSGIVLLLLSLVVTRYTIIGLKRYAELNFSLLKGH